MTIRHALGTGLALTLGLACVPLGCESWDQPAFPHIHPLPDPARDELKLPASVVQQLTACAEQVPGRSPSGKPKTHNMTFDVQATQDGRVSAVALEAATPSNPALVACIAGVLRGMTLPMDDLPLRVSAAAPRGRLAPESRALAGFPLAGLLTASFGTVVIAVTGLVLVVWVVVYVSEQIVSAILAPARATPAAVPSTAAVPKTRKYPNQTCEDDELEKLEDQKEKLCNSGYAANCTGNRERPEVKERHEQIPCSAIMLSISQRLLCLEQRNLIENRCFGGIPDKGHQEAIDNVQRGINHCEALKAINCAKGHPMAGF